MTLGFSSSHPPHISPTLYSAVVCYQANRDELRRRIIQWLEAEIIPDGWFSKGSNYSEILDKYFKVIRVKVNMISPREGNTPISPSGAIRRQSSLESLSVPTSPVTLWSCESCSLLDQQGHSS